ncbi:MAG: restriction endonuclease subunit S, partial [Candidatus Pacebacteria bacterium]|nr:restriction endonuclease subunit S [Candidatus Paceibacterota bacterium]
MQKSKLKFKNQKWGLVPILQYCDFERGTEPGSKSYNREGEGVPFIRVGNIAAQIQEQIYTTSKNIKLCDENDILIALDGSPGVVVRGFKGAHSSGIRKVIVKQPDKLLKDFVYFVLQADSVQKIIEKYATGMTIKHASKSLEHLEIPLPPPSEQKKIVYVLDSIQDAIRAQEKIIEKTKELKKSLLNEIFNSKIKNQKWTKLGNTNYFEIKLGG